LATDNGLDFGVLGALRLTIDGTSVPLGTPKQRAVLAVLVINRNRTVSVESLVDAAWDRRPPPEARVSLHAYVSNLRRLLTAAGVDGRTVLAHAPPGYRLNIAEMSCDIGRFVADKTAGVRAAAATHFEEASNHFSAALAEWRGAVLEDLYDFSFVDSFAAAMIEDKLLVHIARAEVEMACGRANAVIGELEALTAEHRYLEPLWAQLITAYYVSDRQSDALDAYQRLKSTLAEDLGIDPSPTLRNLQERILRQEPLDLKQAARETAIDTVTNINRRGGISGQSPVARLRAASGQIYSLQGAATRIGRLSDNDVVLRDPNVSRHHAVIVDTGASFVIIDLRSANGVHVQGKPIHIPTTLDDGDPVRIGDQELVFEIHHQD
jgi:SARP family transcriptional regulator, regulator of embCAB operon